MKISISLILRRGAQPRRRRRLRPSRWPTTRRRPRTICLDVAGKSLPASCQVPGQPPRPARGHLPLPGRRRPCDGPGLSRRASAPPAESAAYEKARAHGGQPRQPGRRDLPGPADVRGAAQRPATVAAARRLLAERGVDQLLEDGQGGASAHPLAGRQLRRRRPGPAAWSSGSGRSGPCPRPDRPATRCRRRPASRTRPCEPAPIQACFSGSVITETPRPKPWPSQNGMPMNGICRWASVRRLVGHQSRRSRPSAAARRRPRPCPASCGRTSGSRRRVEIRPPPPPSKAGWRVGMREGDVLQPVGRPDRSDRAWPSGRASPAGTRSRCRSCRAGRRCGPSAPGPAACPRSAPTRKPSTSVAWL